MQTCVIPACKSLTITSKYPENNISGEAICIGKNEKHTYYSYLDFDISILPNNIELISADLVLFKRNYFVKPISTKLYIYPLIDYFSSYTTYENHPRWNVAYKKEFNPLTKNVVVEIDIIDIVRKWLKCKWPCKGLFICFDGRQTDIPLACFGSAYSDDETIIPFIRICYDASLHEYYKHHKKHKHPPHPCPPPEETIGCILESIALEEAGLAHIINAEGEKIQRAVNDSNMDVHDLISVNEAVSDTLKNIFKVESLLQFKLENVEKILRNLHSESKEN